MPLFIFILFIFISLTVMCKQQYSLDIRQRGLYLVFIHYYLSFHNTFRDFSQVQVNNGIVIDYLCCEVVDLCTFYRQTSPILSFDFITYTLFNKRKKYKNSPHICTIFYYRHYQTCWKYVYNVKILCFSGSVPQKEKLTWSLCCPLCL